MQLGRRRAPAADQSDRVAAGSSSSWMWLQRILHQRLLLAGLLLLASTAYGKGISSIPSPDDPSTFWISNTAAPWLAIAFVAGAVQTTSLSAVVMGAAADITVVAAFYSHFLMLRTDGASNVSRLLSWIDFVGPWFVVALLGGAAYGYLGHIWRTKRNRFAAVLLGIPFVAESLVQRVTDGQWPGSPGFFFSLGMFGVVLAAAAWLLVTCSRAPEPES